MSHFFLLSSCITLFLFILGSFQLATSYPTGAGTCEAGPAVLYSSSPHLEIYGNGTLSDGGYTTSIGDGTFTLAATGSGNYFKGFLFRLSSNDTSAAGAFQLRSTYSNITQLMNSTGEAVGNPATCDVSVAGVTHREKSEKTEVSVRMSLKGGVNYSLMITVVKNWNEWYYSQQFYRISNTVAAVPTAAPTQLLTESPSSTNANITVIATAKNSPTSAPTATPTAGAPTSNAPTPAAPTGTKNAPTAAAPTGAKNAPTTAAPTGIENAPTTAAPTKTLPTTAKPTANAPTEAPATTSTKTSMPSGMLSASNFSSTAPSTSAPVSLAPAKPFGAGNAATTSKSSAPMVRTLTSLFVLPLFLFAWLT